MYKNIITKPTGASNDDYAIKVSNLSKAFRIPHEKVSTLRGAFVSAFHKKSYENFEALKNISFEVKKGEFFGIIGRNGSGKSTLLKLLAGIYEPDGGKISISGRISPFLELGIGFNPELSGRDNIYLNATVLGLTKKQIDEKFDSIVGFSELERFIDQKLKNYSSGMQVRLAFSVAIHANREILLMDEVLAVGDSNFQSKCLTEFSRYKEMGKTVILVSHDIATIQRYCDRAMLIKNGIIEKIGLADEVGEEYISQNMSDEEKRISKEPQQEVIKDETPIENLNKKAEIYKIEFLDKDKKEKNVFETGDDLIVRAYFKHKQELDHLNFSLTIHDQEGNYFFGINSFIDKIDVKQFMDKGYFQMDFSKIPLKNNNYLIKAGIFGINEMESYDFFQKKVRIFSRGKSHGPLELNYSWK